MNKFDKLLEENLDNLPSVIQPGKYDAMREISQDIKLVEKRLYELKIKFRHAQEEYNALLATNLRKKIPGLSVSLNNGDCSVNYKSKLLVCRPDISSDRWHFEPNTDGRRFTRNNGHTLGLSNNIDNITDAISNYFSKHYKSLNRD